METDEHTMTRDQIEKSQDNWKYRRRLTYQSVYAMLGMMCYLTVWGSGDNEVQAMAMQMLPFGVAGIVLAYVTGAVADDAFKMHLSKS